MVGGSVEATLELWASSLRDIKKRIRPLFQQERMAASAGLFLDALLGPERRKTGWMRAEAGGDPGPWRQQALLGRATGDADALRDVVRNYAVETLAEPDAVLVVDETGFLKQGKASRSRRAAAHVPEDVTFATKPQLARAMIERAIKAGCRSPGWRLTASTAWARSR